MSEMLLLQLFAVIVLSLVSLALCQMHYQGLPQNKLLLGQDPSLKKFSDRAKRGSSIYTEIMGEGSTVLVEENVNVNIDCLPWFENQSSTDVRQISWVLQCRNENGDSKPL